MRIRWDESKRKLVLKKRGINFFQMDELFALPYIEDQKRDNPEQYRVVGFISGCLTTFIVEYRKDKLGEYVWVITAWSSTKQEIKSYEDATR